jgi:hypothetical protein
MQNIKGSKISFSSMLGIIFFILLFAAMFFRDYVFELIAPPAVEISESKKASKEVAEALLKLDKITLDTTILKSPYFQNIVVLPTFPTDSKTLANFGKINPFLGGYQIINIQDATSTTGGVIFSQQRSVNNDRSVVPVRNGQGQTPNGRR